MSSAPVSGALLGAAAALALSLLPAGPEAELENG
jgi:hypothetical protein